MSEFSRTLESLLGFTLTLLGFAFLADLPNEMRERLLAACFGVMLSGGFSGAVLFLCSFVLAKVVK